ncbi:MAG: autoinducer-2 kinase [Synergistota bacterium]|nr:autoinducer-2 kinase [Synergistota bacterium]
MAIDAGTGSARAVLFDEEGRQLAASSAEWSHREDPRFPGSMDFDVEGNWALVTKCVRGAISAAGVDPASIAAVATTSMREAIVLYDGEGREIWACANVDARSSAEVVELMRLRDGIERELYAVSGQTFALGALPRLLWIKRNLPEVYNSARTVNMLNDWIAYRLSEELVAEPSNGCTTGIFDLAVRSWRPETAVACGLRPDIYPPVVESGGVIGRVSPECAAQTGLCTDTLVISGGGDAQLGCVGAGVAADGQAAVLGGSFWQYEYNTSVPRMDPECRVRVNCHAVPGLFQYEAIAFFPGLVMRWFRDAFCQEEKRIEAEGGPDAYEQLAAAASRVPAGSHGMMCAFSDVMYYISWKHASPTFTNFALDATRFDKYTFFRALMENAALVTRGHLDLVEQVTGRRPAEIVFAGGASKSPLWSQIMADVLDLPVRTPEVKEATALGAAICAGIGAGVYGGIDDAVSRTVRMEAVFEPDRRNRGVYDELRDRWSRMYAAQLKLADEGVASHMWRAPGV